MLKATRTRGASAVRTILAVGAASGAALLAGCGALQSLVAEETRPQDERTYAVKPGSLQFDALANSSVATDRWTGMLNGSGYRIEVPKNWNGKLVMYAHGYTGTGPDLVVSNPRFRRWLVDNGYAWAASSYSKNYYDVRAGVEDTNALALAFNRIAEENKRPLAPPQRIYITGVSMGGHITAAAIEEETARTAVNKVRYHGAVPMCGVLGDTELFDYFTAYQLAAQQLAGMPAKTFPVADWKEIAPKVQSALFTSFPKETTPQGDKLKAIVRNLSGGARPIFDQGFAELNLHRIVWGTFGTDGTVNGILTRNIADNTNTIYRFGNAGATSPEDAAFNASVLRVKAAPDANRPRRDGLRWIPKVNGEIGIPVVSMHTLGDMYVPFGMEQIYRRRVDAKGNGKRLVQRAIRAPGHCDFTAEEQAAAFRAMVDWEQNGVRPEGDDVLTPSVVADPKYGCRFTDNTTGPDDVPTIAPMRASLPKCS